MTSMRIRPRSLVRAASLSLGLFAIGSLTQLHHASADVVRTGDARTIKLGETSGDSSLYRGDRGRTNHVAKVPSSLTPLWRTRIRGGVEQPHVITHEGNVLTVSGNEIVEIDRDGKEKRRIRVPDAPSQAPLVTTNDDRIVITTKGECFSFSPRGAQRFQTTLPATSQYSVVPTISGGIVTVAGNSLIELDSDGVLVATGKLPQRPVTDLMARGDVIYTIGEKGDVISWKRPDAPKVVGALSSSGGSSASGAALVDDRTMIAIVESRDIVFFDLASGTARNGPTSPLISWENSPAIGTAGVLFVTNSNGALVEISPEGKEKSRTILEPTSAASADSTSGGPPVVVADDGTVVFARDRAGVGLARGGSVVVATDKSPCSDPIGLTADATRVIVSCRDGVIAAFGDK